VRQYEYEVMHAEELRHWWFRGRRRVLVDLLRTVAESPEAARRILDFGCGTGGNSSAFATLGTVVGIEPDATAVKLASQRGAGQYCRGGGTRLPFRRGVFDVVVASDVLEHIEDHSAAVVEIARVLRPGGSAIFSVPAHQWLFSEHDAALHHFRRYSKAALRTVLERGGFSIRRLTYWNATLFPAICLHRLWGRRAGSGGPQSDISSAPPLVNAALTALLGAEAAILRHASLPWGVSLIAVAERV
jgi:SAM-dependent methyltransferase